MNYFKYLSITLLLILSCDRQNEYDYPVILTGEVTDIDGTGAVFHAKITASGENDILEYGFVWSKNENPDLTSSHIIISGKAKVGPVSIKATTDLNPDTYYFVRAFARNDSYTTYGKQVKFLSKGSMIPSILDFTPKEGTGGTEVTITGNNFSAEMNGNIVKFGRAIAVVEQSASDRLVVRIPDNLTISGTVNISVESSNRKITSGTTFFLYGCDIISFSPSTSLVGDTLYIQASDISSDIQGNTLRVGGNYADLISVTGNMITATVPYTTELGLTELSLTVNGKTCFSRDSVMLKNPWGKIDGNNPFYRADEAGFKIGSKGYVGFGWSVRDGGGGPYNDLWEFNFDSNTWKRCADLPSDGRRGPVAFAIGGKGYAGLGIDNTSGSYLDFFEYDPTTNSWTRKSDFPGSGRAAAFNLVIGNKAYIGMGFDNYSAFKDFWEYDPINDKWTQLGDYPGDGIINVKSFEINGKGYIGMVGSREFWEYTPDTDSWRKLADFPGVIRNNSVSFSLDNYGYTGSGISVADSEFLIDFWRYNVKNDKWTRISDIPYLGRSGSISYSAGTKGYMLSGYNISGASGNNDENFIVYTPN